MTREQVIERLKKCDCDYAILTIDVWDENNELVYPKEKVIVSVLETINPMNFIGKAYTTFESIRDFRENSVFGENEARASYCKYYFGDIHEMDLHYE